MSKMTREQAAVEIREAGIEITFAALRARAAARAAGLCLSPEMERLITAAEPVLKAAGYIRG